MAKTVNEAINDRGVTPDFLVKETESSRIFSVSMLTFLSRVVGFVRVIAMSVWVGSRNVAHAFSAANQIPNVLFEVIAGGALSAALVPVISTPLKLGKRRQAEQVASAALTWSVLIGFVLAVVLWGLAYPIAAIFPTAGDEQAQVAAMGLLLSIFAWQIPFYAFGVAATGILHTVRRFIMPALAPILSSVTVIGGFAVFGLITKGADSVTDRSSLLVLAWGVNAGVLALTLPLLLPLARCGLHLRPTLLMDSAFAWKLLKLGGAGFISVLAQQLAMLAVIWAARAYGEVGAQSVFMYAQSIAALPYAILVMPLVTVMFPAIAQSQAHKRSQQIEILLGKITAAALLAVAVIVAVAPAAQAFFSVLTPVPGMAISLIVMAPSVLGMALSFALTRIFLALGDASGVRILNLVGWGIVAVTSVIFPAIATTGREHLTSTTVLALGLAHTVGLACGGLLGLRYLSRRYVGISLLRVPMVDIARTIPALVLAPVSAYLSIWFSPVGIIAAIGIGIGAVSPILMITLWWWLRGGLEEELKA